MTKLSVDKRYEDSVSYTHLDVYKRQVQTMTAICSIVQIAK